MKTRPLDPAIHYLTVRSTYPGEALIYSKPFFTRNAHRTHARTTDVLHDHASLKAEYRPISSSVDVLTADTALLYTYLVRTERFTASYCWDGRGVIIAAVYGNIYLQYVYRFHASARYTAGHDIAHHTSHRLHCNSAYVAWPFYAEKQAVWAKP